MGIRILYRVSHSWTKELGRFLAARNWTAETFFLHLWCLIPGLEVGIRDSPYQRCRRFKGLMVWGSQDLALQFWKSLRCNFQKWNWIQLKKCVLHRFMRPICAGISSRFSCFNRWIFELRNWQQAIIPILWSRSLRLWSFFLGKELGNSRDLCWPRTWLRSLTHLGPTRCQSQKTCWTTELFAIAHEVSSSRFWTLAMAIDGCKCCWVLWWRVTTEENQTNAGGSSATFLHYDMQCTNLTLSRTKNQLCPQDCASAYCHNVESMESY